MAEFDGDFYFDFCDLEEIGEIANNTMADFYSFIRDG
jgi:hypothetical protein